MLIISLACSLEVGFVDAGTIPEFSVMNFGAIGDGVADDTQAFTKAWTETCAATTGSATMIVPEGKTFLVKPTIFSGPCMFRKVYIRLEGKVIAPDDPYTWNDISAWLQFQAVRGLNIIGHGEINGRGQKFWNQSCKINNNLGCINPQPLTGVVFVDCIDLTVRYVRSVDSPMFHFVVLGSRRVAFNGLTITAPGNSPNTDGIHLADSNNVTIQYSTIQTGDDCVSIGNNVFNVTIDSVVCGPGHGISIGSLGRFGNEVHVEQVNVRYSNFSGTENGARIKTWQGGKGNVRGISFEHCYFNNVDNPIIIDQYYCDSDVQCQSKPSNVNISNVKYIDLHGTSKTENAISLKCSASQPCTELEFDMVNFIGSDQSIRATAMCINAWGSTRGFIQPAISCLR